MFSLFFSFVRSCFRPRRGLDLRYAMPWQVSWGLMPSFQSDRGLASSVLGSATLEACERVSIQAWVRLMVYSVMIIYLWVSNVNHQEAGISLLN